MFIGGQKIKPQNTATNTNITTGDDGLIVANVTIQNSSTSGDLIVGDGWKSITIYSIMANNAGSGGGVGVFDSIPKILFRGDLNSDGSLSDTGLNNTREGNTDAKNIYIHKTSGTWRLRHTSHGMNYNYIVVFSIVTT